MHHLALSLRRVLSSVLVCLALCAGAPAAAATDNRAWVVGTKQAPPFAIKKADGSWGGISIELWKSVAEQMGIRYELREYDLQGLLDAVASGEVDAAVAALTVTPEREQRFDFSHPFYTTGLSIAVRAEGGSLPALLGRVVSGKFLVTVGFLLAVLLAVGVLVWFFERRANSEQFGGSAAQGVGSGFWWSAVTMTTVGYGDKAPRTLGGRAVGLLWMFASIILISGFTGAIASSLTVGQLEGAVRGSEDLPKVKVGTVPASTSEAYLRGRRVGYRTFASPREGMQAVAEGTIDAMVYDAPLLRYLVNTQFRDHIEIVPGTFLRQDYAIALPAQSAAREEVNRVLIATIQGSLWQEVLYRYLGE